LKLYILIPGETGYRLPDRIHYDGDWNCMVYHYIWIYHNFQTVSTMMGIETLMVVNSTILNTKLPDRIHYDGDWNLGVLVRQSQTSTLPDRIHYDGDWNFITNISS